MKLYLLLQNKKLPRQLILSGLCFAVSAKNCRLFFAMSRTDKKDSLISDCLIFFSLPSPGGRYFCWRTKVTKMRSYYFLWYLRWQMSSPFAIVLGRSSSAPYLSPIPLSPHIAMSQSIAISSSLQPAFCQALTRGQ